MKLRAIPALASWMLAVQPGCGGGLPSPEPGGSPSIASQATVAAYTANAPSPARAVPPAAGACALRNVAFCETFSHKGQGVRAAPLDPQRLGVARIGPAGNPPQGALDPWRPASAQACDGKTRRVVPPNDYFLCPSTPNGQHLRQAYDDAGDFTVHSIGIRQLFDFTNRKGTYAFEVDGWFTPGHGTWLESWVTDEPIPVPYQSAPGVEAVGRNAVGLELRNESCSMDATKNGVSTLFIIRNFKTVRTMVSPDFDESHCFRTQRGVLNRIEVRLTRTSIEVLATDAGKPKALRRIALVKNLDLGLTRGFVHVQHSHYNAAKGGHPSSETHLWDNLGFDGPSYARPRTHEIPDSLEPFREGKINVGYSLAAGKIQRFDIDKVDVTNVRSGSLNASFTNFLKGMSLKHRFNGGKWRTHAHPFPDSTDKWRSLSAPVTLSDLKAGKNTLELAVEGSNEFTTVANIDVQLVPGP
jgi:hypothetical protein